MKKVDFKIGSLYKTTVSNIDTLYFFSADENPDYVSAKSNVFLLLEERIDKLQKKIYIFYSLSEKRKISVGDSWCHKNMKEIE